MEMEVSPKRIVRTACEHSYEASIVSFYVLDFSICLTVGIYFTVVYMYLLEDDWVADPGVWDVELLQWSLHHAVLRLSHAGQADEALEPRAAAAPPAPPSWLARKQASPAGNNSLSCSGPLLFNASLQPRSRYIYACTVIFLDRS